MKSNSVKEGYEHVRVRPSRSSGAKTDRALRVESDCSANLRNSQNNCGVLCVVGTEEP